MMIKLPNDCWYPTPANFGQYGMTKVMVDCEALDHHSIEVVGRGVAPKWALRIYWGTNNTEIKRKHIMQSTTLNKKPLIGPRHWNFLSVRVNTFE
jgi:hypothetical protein